MKNKRLAQALFILMSCPSMAEHVGAPVPSKLLENWKPRTDNCHIQPDSPDYLKKLFQKYLYRGQNGRAPAALVWHVDAQGRIVDSWFEQNIDTPQPVASIQKILTAYTAYREGLLNAKVTFTREAALYDLENRNIDRARDPISQLPLNPGDQILGKHLLWSLLNHSSNGAALALAQVHPQGPSGFMRAMNSNAALLLGRKPQSYFQNPAGLTPIASAQLPLSLLILGDPARCRHSIAHGCQESTAREMGLFLVRIWSDPGFRNSLASAGVNGVAEGKFYKGGLTNAAGKTMVRRLPIGGRCKGHGLYYVAFGEGTQDQMARFINLDAALKKNLADFEKSEQSVRP